MLDVHRSVSQYRIPKSESDAEREGDSEVKGGTIVCARTACPHCK